MPIWEDVRPHFKKEVHKKVVCKIRTLSKTGGKPIWENTHFKGRYQHRCKPHFKQKTHSEVVCKLKAFLKTDGTPIWNDLYVPSLVLLGENINFSILLPSVTQYHSKGSGKFALVFRKKTGVETTVFF